MTTKIVKNTKKIVEKTAKKTAQKTFAEIIKQNSSNNKIWKLVSKKTKILNILSQLASKKGQIAAVDRRILFIRENESKKTNLQDLLLALNRTLIEAQMPQHIRLLSLSFIQKGSISGLLQEKAITEMLNSVHNQLLLTTKEVDSSIKNLSAAENWHKIKIHKVDLFRYSKKGGLVLLKEEIESTISLNLLLLPQWLRKDSSERFNNGEISYSSVLVTVRDITTAEKCIAKGVYFGEYNHKCEKFVINNPWDLCPICCEYDYNSHKKCENNTKYFICAGNHSAIEHKCIANGCTAKIGRICVHYVKKCVICKGAHFADSEICSKRRQLIQLVKQRKSEQKDVKKTIFCEQNAQTHPNIQIIIPSKSTNIAMNNDNQMDIFKEL